MRWRRGAQQTPQPRPPWEYPGLPDGLSGDAFDDAAVALLGAGHQGRVQALPADLHHRDSLLSGTHYPANHARVTAARKLPPMLPPPTLGKRPPPGTVLPGLLMTDPSEGDGEVRPVAVILPTGYVGSIWGQTSTILATWVDSHAQGGWWWALPVVIGTGAENVRAWHPTYRALTEGPSW